MVKQYNIAYEPDNSSNTSPESRDTLNNQKELLGTAPITPLMTKLIIPSMTAQIINLMYNIVDRIFIGRIPDVGETALTGVGVSFPILLIISAFAAFAGMGGAPLASMSMGAGNKERAEEILGSAVVMILCFSTILTLFFSLFKVPILYAFGASDATIDYAIKYVSVYVVGTIFVQISLGLNTFITAQGQAKIAMASVTIGAVINIALDFLFITQLNFGVRGAAFATVISQSCSAIWVLCFLLSEKSALRIRKEYVRWNPNTIKSIMQLGIAPFIMQSTESLVNITLNKNLQEYGNLAFLGGGDLYVGVMTIQQSVMQMIMLPLNGIAQGTQPILGFNFGANNYGRVRETFKKLIITALVFSTTTSGLVILFPKVVAGIFATDPQLIESCGETMPIFFAGIWAIGAQMSCQTTFMAMGQAKTSLFLACLRKIILLIPLAILLPKVTGNVLSIFYAEPIADVLTSCTTFSLFMYRRKELLPTESLSSPE